jgi:cell division protein FtsZ
MLEFDQKPVLKHAKLVVFGVGGAGCNAINNMIEYGLEDVEYIAANTDLAHLNISHSKVKIQLGKKITQGRGAGSEPEKGKLAAEENYEDIKHLMDGADLVLIAAGMGGGTGTGAAPVIAKIAQEKGIISIAVVTTPFDDEGRIRRENAKQGLLELRKYIDSYLIIPNQKIYDAYPDVPAYKAYQEADLVLYNSAKAIADVINKSYMMNAELSDLITILRGNGRALIGIGTGEGETRAADALRNAIENPLLNDVSLENCTGVVYQLLAGQDIPTSDLKYISEEIHKLAGDDAHIIRGTHFDESNNGKITLTVIASGLVDPDDFLREAKNNARKPQVETPQYNPNLQYGNNQGLGNPSFGNDNGNIQSYPDEPSFDVDADEELKRIMDGIDLGGSNQRNEKRSMSPLETKPMDFSRNYND